MQAYLSHSSLPRYKHTVVAMETVHFKKKKANTFTHIKLHIYLIGVSLRAKSTIYIKALIINNYLLSNILKNIL